MKLTLNIILAALFAAILGCPSYFMVDFAYLILTQWQANPTDVGLFIGFMMAACTAIACVGATVCGTIMTLTDKE